MDVKLIELMRPSAVKLTLSSTYDFILAIFCVVESCIAESRLST